MNSEGDRVAKQLLTMDEASRRRQLTDLRTSNKPLHAVVKQKLEEYRTKARSVGQQGGMQQVLGGQPQQ